MFCRFCRNNIYVHVQLDGEKKRARVNSDDLHIFEYVLSADVSFGSTLSVSFMLIPRNITCYSRMSACERFPIKSGTGKNTVEAKDVLQAHMMFDII